MMGLSLEMKAIAILTLLAALLFGARAVISAHDRRAVADVQAQYAAQALKATMASDAESARREAARADVINESRLMADRARRDSGLVAPALDRLRGRASVALGSGLATHPRPASGGASAPDAAYVPAELFERLGETAGRLAALADERGIAGNACERAYLSLTPSEPPKETP